MNLHLEILRCLFLNTWHQEVKVSRNAVPVKEWLPVRRSAKSFKYANMCCCCSTHVFLLCCQQNILQKNERTTSENEWNTVQRKPLRWITMRNVLLWRCEWIIVTYSLSHRTSEAVFKLHEDSYILSFRPGVLAFYEWNTGKGKI